LRVRLFEDNYFFGERIRDALLAWEFDVEWCVGADDVTSTGIQGIAADCTDSDRKIVSIKAADVDFVFTDCMLIGKYSGVDIVRWCVARGIPVVAISGSPDDNQRMIDAGAMRAVLKELVSQFILAGCQSNGWPGMGEPW
jgi:hypothetical protein